MQAQKLKKTDETNSNHQEQMLESRKYLNELTSQKEEYTIEEAKEITKKVLKKYYDSIK